jgi:hypothetical protein
VYFLECVAQSLTALPFWRHADVGPCINTLQLLILSAFDECRCRESFCIFDFVRDRNRDKLAFRLIIISRSTFLWRYIFHSIVIFGFSFSGFRLKFSSNSSHVMARKFFWDDLLPKSFYFEASDLLPSSSNDSNQCVVSQKLSFYLKTLFSRNIILLRKVSIVLMIRTTSAWLPLRWKLQSGNWSIQIWTFCFCYLIRYCPLSTVLCPKLFNQMLVSRCSRLLGHPVNHSKMSACKRWLASANAMKWNCVPLLNVGVPTNSKLDTTVHTSINSSSMGAIAISH